MLACGLPLIGYGLIFNLWWALPGAVLVIAAVFGWVMEPSTDPDAGHDHGDPHDDDHGPEAAALEAGDADAADGAEAQAETEEAPVG